MLLGGQEEQCPRGMLLCNHNFFSCFLLLLFVFWMCLYWQLSHAVKEMFIIFWAAFSVLLQKMFLCETVYRMTRNGNPSFSLLHISIRNLSPWLCRNFSFEGHPWHPLAESNIHLAGLRLFNLSSIWQFGLFLLIKKYYLFIFTLLLFTMFSSWTIQFTSCVTCLLSLCWVCSLSQGSAIWLFLFSFYILDDFPHLRFLLSQSSRITDFHLKSNENSAQQV